MHPAALPGIAPYKLQGTLPEAAGPVRGLHLAQRKCQPGLPAGAAGPGAQRGFQRGAPFDTFLLAFGVYQKRVVVRGRNPAAK